MNARRISALAMVGLLLVPGALILPPAATAAAPRGADEAAPEPFFTVEPGFGTTATRFVVDPRGSNVPNGTSLSLAWGDGSYLNATRTAAGFAWPDGAVTPGLRPLNHTYATVGTKTLVLSLQHPTLGGAKAYAQVHVLSVEPDQRTRAETARLRQGEVTPNNAVEVAQESAYGAVVPGTIVALVAGIEPDALPLNLSGNLLNLTYVRCTVDGCDKLGLETANDTDGASTSAFTVMLQKAINARYVAVDVQGPDGQVHLETLVNALTYAAGYPADVVVSLLSPDAGFAAPASAASPYDPYGLLASLLPPEEEETHDAIAFWRGLVANRARHDFGGSGNATYPVPNGFDDDAVLHFGADGHAHEHHAGAHTHGGADLPYGGHGEACLPMPPAGPRHDPEAFPALVGYQEFEPALKDPHRLHPQDLSYLPASERAALDLHLHHVLMHVCLDLALANLAHKGVPVVVPAGDDARHQKADDPPRATWHLQTLADLAAHPQVITVGATSSDVAPYGYPYFGTQRVVLPSSGAGPARGLYGVKPDLLAPADIPVPMLGNMTDQGATAARIYNLVENFTGNVTRGWLRGNTQWANGVLRVGHNDSPTLSGVVFNSSDVLPPRPLVEADVQLVRQTNSLNNGRTRFMLAAQNGTTWAGAEGYGLELAVSSANWEGCASNCGGSLEVVTHVWSASREYYPACVLNNCVTPPTKANLPLNTGYRVRIMDVGEANVAGHRLYVFELNKSGDPTVLTRLFREVKVDAEGRACQCRNLTFQGTAVTGGVLVWAHLDNVFAAGVVEDAEAQYVPGVPVSGVPVSGPVAVRPTTRVAAAYVAGVALLENALLASEEDDTRRLVALRGRLASMARPLDGVPPFVQGAGELNADGAPVSLLRHGLESPGVDFGLQTKTGARSTVGFFRPITDPLVSHEVSVDFGAAKWFRVGSDGRAVPTQEAPGFAVQVARRGSDALNLTLTLTSLPATPGVYGANVPVRVVTAGALPNLFYSPLNLTVMVTRGVDYTLDVRGTGVPDGAHLWLLAHDHGRHGGTHLVHEPLSAGPAANATVKDGLAAFGDVAQVNYDLVMPHAAGLPVPTSLGGHEAGRPRSIVTLARHVVPVDGVAASPVLTFRAPVAFRFLDLQQGGDLAASAIAPPATFDEGLRAPVPAPAAAWNLRGDPARAEGRALDEPLPVGETAKGWDLRVVGRAPPEAIGDALDVRALYEAYAASPTAFRHTALAGHLDPRPYLVDRDAGALPWVRLDTSFAIPAPTQDAHGVLVLPLQLEGASAMVRLTMGQRDASFLVTPDGLWRPVSPDGLTWNVEGDRYDDLPDANGRGVLSGFGHLHAPTKPGLGLFRATPSGFLVPFSFHDLESPSTLNVTVLLKPDPLSSRALGGTPLDPVPGPRFRLDGLGLYAWTRGEADLRQDKLEGLDARDLSRFVRGGAAPRLRVTPFASDAPILSEFLEVYTRGPAGAASAADANGANKVAAGVLRDVRALADAQVLDNTLGRALIPADSVMLHPEGVLDPYGIVTPRPAAGHVKEIPFMGAGTALWRVEDDAIAAASADGRFTVVYDRAASGASADLLVREPFPDFADVDRPPATPDDRCLLGELGALVYAPYARQACLDLYTVYDDLLGVYEAYNVSASLDAGLVQAGTTQDVGGTGGGACLDGGDGAGSACMSQPLDLVNDTTGRLHLRAAFRGLGGGAGAPAPGVLTQPTLLWSGTVPPTGALLVLRHRLDARGVNVTPTGLLEANVSGSARPLPTLEGDAVLTTAGAARGGWRTDVFDLAGYAGVDTAITAVPTDANWSVDWRLLPRAQPAPLGRLDDTRFVVTDSPSTVVPALQAVPEGGATARVGPAEVRKASEAAAPRVVASRGLVVASGVETIRGKHLVVGGDAGEGAMIHVKAGARLILEDALVSPRNPRQPFGILVDEGGRLDLTNVTLLRGGGPLTAGATLLVHGHAVLHDVNVLNGATGVRVGPTGRLDATESTFGRLARAIEVDGGRAHLARVLVDGNVVGILARNATVEVSDATLTGNRDAAILAQDSLVGVTDATFAWNGEAGPRAALVALEGLDTGRVVVTGSRFHHNGRAVDARADVDLHDTLAPAAKGPSLAVRGGARLRLEAVTAHVTSGPSLFLDAASVLETSNSSVMGSPHAIECAKAGRPAAVYWTFMARGGSIEGDCGPLPLTTTTRNFHDASLWRGLAFRPFLRPGDNDVLVLPAGATTGVSDVLGSGVSLVDGKLRVDAGDRDVLLTTGTPGAWRTPAEVDGTPPSSAETKLDAPIRRGFTSAVSVPFQYLGLSEPLAASDLWVSSETSDGRLALSPIRVLEDARGDRAVLGPGAMGPLPIVTGEKVTVQPLLKDRAGNAAWGKATSVVFDRTPPRAWISAANPCGELLGHDLSWRGHDPMVGSGLPLPEEGHAYVVYVAALNLTALKDDLGMEAVDKLRTANPQEVNAIRMERLDRVLPRVVDTVDPWNLLPLWVEIGRFDRTVEGVDWRPVDWERFRDVNRLTNDTALQLWAAKEKLNASLAGVAQNMTQNMTRTSNLLPLTKTLDELLTGALDNVQKLNPIVLAVKVETVDAVGNKGVAIEPVLADAFAPTPLLYLLGDTFRERLAPLVLGPSARVSLSDRHVELSLFDPDCGIEAVEVLSGAIGQGLAPVATHFPKDGRVSYKVESMAAVHPASVCGWRDVAFRARDVFGRTTDVHADALVDRLAPLTTVAKMQPVLLPTPLPLFGNVPQPQLEEGKWIGRGGIEVSARGDSRNEGACAPSAIHDTAVQAQIAGSPWSTLLRVHHGSLLASAPAVPQNATAWLNATFDFTPEKLDATSLGLSGANVSLRVLSTDEAGNDEASTLDVRTFRFDRQPPVCRLDPLPVHAGFKMPVTWSAHDGNQTIAGNLSDLYLVYRAPNVTQTPWMINGVTQQWTVYGALPRQASGSATVRMQEQELIFPVTPRRLADVQVACLAYDAAGNGAIDPASVRYTNLDLGLPWITLPDLPLFSRPDVQVNWSAGDNLTGLAQVRVYAGREGGPLELRSNGTTGSLVLAPNATSADDGQRWRVRVEARDNVDNEHVAEISTILDLSPPSCSWGGVQQVLDELGRFLPAANHTFATVCQNLGNGNQSPLDVALNVTGPVVRGFKPLAGTNSTFNVSSLPGGAYVATLRACDAAGNCMSPLPSLTFSLDFRAPGTVLVDVENGTAPTTLHVHGPTVNWVDPTVHARFRVLDAVEAHGSSGVDRLEVRVRRLDRVTLAEVGPTYAAVATRAGTEGAAVLFDAVFSGPDFLPNTLHRYEVRAWDRSGNVENVSGTWPNNVTDRLFAWDNVPPSTTMGPIPEVVGMAREALSTTLTLRGGFSDASGGYDSGVVKLIVDLTKGGVQQPPDERAPNGPPYALDVTLPRADDGLVHEFCVRAKDASGLVGACLTPDSTLLDATWPLVQLLPPEDVAGGLDVYTNRTPVNLTLRVTNDAPEARDASGLVRAVLDVVAGGRSLVLTNLTGISVPPRATRDVDVSLDSPDGTVHQLRGYARDAAGNDGWGAADPLQPIRAFGEEAHYPLNATNGLVDASGRGHALATGAAGTVPATVSTPWGSGRRFDGDDQLTLSDRLNLGSFTAMAWLKPDAAGAAPVFGKTSVSDDWALGLDAANRPYALVRTGGGASTALGDPVEAAGRWVHLALVYDGATVKVLVDGNVAASAARTGTVQETVTGFVLGRGSPGQPHLAGTLDEVRLYKRALAPEEVDEVRRNPYGSVHFPSTTVHLDHSAPKAVPVVNATHQLAALVGTLAYDPANGTNSGLDTVRLQGRALGGPLAWGDATLARNLRGGPLGGADVPAGAAVTAARVFDAGATSRRVSVELRAADNVDDATRHCGGVLFGGTASWDVLVNGVSVRRHVLSADGTAEAAHRGDHLTPVSGAVTVTLRVNNDAAWTASCGHGYAVAFDDLRVLDTATGKVLFTEDFTSWQDWAVAGRTDVLRLAPHDGGEPWAHVAMPDLRFNASWPRDDNDGFALRGAADAFTAITREAGPGGSWSLGLRHAASGAGVTQQPVEVLEKTFTPVAADTLHVTARAAASASGLATLTARMGVSVTLESGKTLVFVLHNESHLAAPPADTFLVDRPIAEDAWTDLQIDLAAAMLANGLSGKVARVGLYLEKQGQALGSSFEARLALDDVRLLEGAGPLRVDLPFAFPLGGAAYRTLWVDEDGVIGFAPAFSDAPTQANFAANRFIAPAWGAWTRKGADAATTAAHGVTVDARQRDQVTLTWRVGKESDPSQTHEFAATLTRTGEILFRYGPRFPDPANVAIVGVSDGVLPLQHMPASFAGRRDGVVPASTGWIDLAATTVGGLEGAALPTANVPWHLRALATDRASNQDPYREAPEAVAYWDTLDPLVLVEPVRDLVLGGFLDRNLSVRTTLLDDGSGINATSVKLRILDHVTNAWTTLPHGIGDGVVTATLYPLVHRRNYTLELTAKDGAGRPGSNATTFEAVIVPEPVFGLARDLLNGTYVDDELVGVAEGVVGRVVGEKLSLKGSASASVQGMVFNITLDGNVIQANASASASFERLIDVTGLAPGLHYLNLNAETSNGSVVTQNYTFRVGGDTLAYSGLETAESAWTFGGAPAAERSERVQLAKRNGTWGARVNATADPGTPEASYQLPDPVGTARHWAFVRLAAAPTGPMDLLRLTSGATVALAVRAEANLTVSVYDGAAWHWTGVPVLEGSWTKVEAKVDGRAAVVYLDHAYVGEWTRRAGGPVTHLRFGAGSAAAVGEMFVDDVAVSLGDPIQRTLLRDEFGSGVGGWIKVGTGGVARTKDPLENPAVRLDSTTNAVEYHHPLRNVTADYFASVNVGRFTGSCGTNGGILRLLATNGTTLLAVRCSGTAIQVLTPGGAWASTGHALGGNYTRVRVAVGPSSYTLFVNEAFAGVHPLLGKGAADTLVLGGGNGRLWYDSVRVERGRVLFGEGFEEDLRSVWSKWLPNAGVTAAVSTEKSVTGGKSYRIHSSGQGGERGTINRTLALPDRFHLEQWVYVSDPEQVTFSELYAMLLYDANGPVIGLGLETSSTGLGSTPEQRWGYYDVGGLDAQIYAGPGWHLVGLKVDQANKTYVPVFGGVDAPQRSYTGGRLLRFVAGDILAPGFPTEPQGGGTIWIDDMVLKAYNVAPDLTISRSEPDADGVIVVSGTLDDRDFGDTPDAFTREVKGPDPSPRAPIARAPSWSQRWNVSLLGPGKHDYLVLAAEGVAEWAAGQVFYVKP